MISFEQNEHIKILRKQCLDGSLKINFLVTSGRSGSSLLASMIDNHPEVILFPVPWYIYVDANRSNKKLFEWSLKQGSLSRQWHFDGLGATGKEAFDLPRDKLLEIQKEILVAWGSQSRRDQILAGLFSWAIYYNQDLTKVKCLMIHHHPVICDYAMKSLYPNFEDDFSEENFLWGQAISDFPQLNLLWTMRHPLEMFTSIYKTLERERLPIDLSRWFMQIWGLLHASNSLIKQSKELGSRSIQFDFIEMHHNWSGCRKKLVDFMKISELECLNQSTVVGKLWIGNNPERPRMGPQPQIQDNDWQTLQKPFQAFSNILLKNLCVSFDYPYTDSEEMFTGLQEIQDSRNWSLAARKDHPARLVNFPQSLHDEFLLNYPEWENKLYQTWCPSVMKTLKTKDFQKFKEISPIALPANWEKSRIQSIIPVFKMFIITRHLNLKDSKQKDRSNRAYFDVESSMIYTSNNQGKKFTLNPYHYDRDRLNLISNQEKIFLVGLGQQEQQEWMGLANSVGVDLEIMETQNLFK